MGVNGSTSRTPRRASYPSGPWIDGIRPYEKETTSPPPKAEKSLNPDPNNWKIIRAEELHGYTVLLIHYPDCKNYEGQKILVYQTPLIDIINQKVIDPHFFADKDFHSPIARLVPNDFGWQTAVLLVNALHGQKQKPPFIHDIINGLDQQKPKTPAKNPKQ